MLRAVLFDLFETLITESGTRPAGVSSLAPTLGCERDAFRTSWKALRPAVRLGRMSFRQALRDIADGLGGQADDLTLQRLADQRARVKAEPLELVEPGVVEMLDHLRSRGLRLGVISNCWAEDVATWSRSSLASRVDCTVFSFEVGVAKPDPAIVKEATRRLGVDASDTWYVADGSDDELSGAEQAGLRPIRATWFLKRWPHFRDESSSTGDVATIQEMVSLVERATS